jgi:ubiquinone/menaquinone biosynthesis C-methylase UbiE
LLAREERHVAPLLPDLAGKTVLDLACGTGRWLEKLMTLGATHGVGVDISAAMLRVAHAKPAIRGLLARADCLKLPFRAATFDFAICSFALSHIDALQNTVSELARTMKPDSDVFVSDFHSDAYARGWRTSFRDDHNVVEIRALPRTGEAIVQGFRASGFECLSPASLRFEESERPIFEQAQKEPLFEDACLTPAILFCHFRLRKLR